MDWAALAAVLSGTGALLSALASIWVLRRQAEKACAERIAEVRSALREGYELRQ